MFNSETLEVAIGMVFLFLMMSLVCTAIKEWIEGVMKWRAMDLERAMRNMLDPENAAGETTQALYNHPIISALFQGSYDLGKLKTSSRWLVMGTAATRHMPLLSRRNLPSYIPTGHFSTAFIDHILRGDPLKTDAADGKPADAPKTASPPPLLSVDALRTRAMASPPHLRKIVLSAVDYANDDIAKVRKSIEHWFDGAMDRASGWYKRRTQALLFIIGLATAVVLNVDSLHILHRLTTDKTLRESVLKRAEAATTAASRPAGVESAQKASSAASPAAGASSPVPAVSGASSAASGAASAASAAATASSSRAASSAAPSIQTFEDELAAVKRTRNELDAVALPIGWEPVNASGAGIAPTQFCAADAVVDGTVTRRCDGGNHGIYAWLRILLGWLITALAIMLGAPFWFDVLNKIMIIRSTVKPHEKSPEEPSQDGGDGTVHRLVVSAAPPDPGK